MNGPTPKPWIMGIHAYVPGKAADDSGQPVAKLSANENPLGTSAAAHKAAQQAIADLATYPDPGAGKLREAIAAAHGLDPARIIVGTGSGELLHMIADVYAGPGDEVIYVNYGFSLYDIVARRAGATPVIAPDSDYGTDVDAVLACVTPATRLVFIANPNNPTGTFISRAEMARLHAALPANVVLVIDQAYAEYVGADEDDQGLALSAAKPNVFATRTFSKIHGLAAERIGWGYGSPEMIDALNRIRGAFNLTSAAQAAATAAAGDTAWVEASRAHNQKWLAWFEGEIASLSNHGLRTVPSRANFSLILFEGKVTAEAAYNALMAAGYATRWLPNQGLPHGLRITIGSKAQMRDVMRVIRALVEAG